MHYKARQFVSDLNSVSIFFLLPSLSVFVGHFGVHIISRFTVPISRLILALALALFSLNGIAFTDLDFARERAMLQERFANAMDWPIVIIDQEELMRLRAHELNPLELTLQTSCHDLALH
jgi:hypothetical protein